MDHFRTVFPPLLIGLQRHIALVNALSRSVTSGEAPAAIDSSYWDWHRNDAGGSATTTLQTPFASFVMGLALAFQLLNAPAHETFVALASLYVKRMPPETFSGAASDTAAVATSVATASRRAEKNERARIRSTP